MASRRVRTPVNQSLKFVRASLEGPKNLVFQELTIDHGQLGPKQIFAETEVSAVSIGTEVGAYAGKEQVRPGKMYPRMVGYSNVATVRKVGKRVTAVRVGDRIFTHQTHQSAFIVDEEFVLAKVPKALSSATASLAYIAQIPMSAYQRVDLRRGQAVAVLGLGAIGLCAVALARAKGCRVVALGNDAYRLEKAKEMGADLCLYSDDPELMQKIEKFCGLPGVDLAVDCLDSWLGWRLSLQLPVFGGKIAVIGFPGRGDGLPDYNPLSAEFTYLKQLGIYHCGLAKRPTGELLPFLKGNMRAILRMAQRGALPLERLITHKVAWSELAGIYEQAIKKDKSLVGAVLDWRKNGRG